MLEGCKSRIQSKETVLNNTNRKKKGGGRKDAIMDDKGVAMSRER